MYQLSRSATGKVDSTQTVSPPISLSPSLRSVAKYLGLAIAFKGASDRSAEESAIGRYRRFVVEGGGEGQGKPEIDNICSVTGCDRPKISMSVGSVSYDCN